MDINEKKRILFIIHSCAPSGGAEDDIYNLLSRLKDSGKYIIDGLLPEGPRKNYFTSMLNKFSNLKWGVFPVINNGYFNYIKYSLKIFIQWFQILKFIKSKKYDLCIVSVAVLVWPMIIIKLIGFNQIIFIKETIEPEFIRSIIYKIINWSSHYVIPNSIIIENEFKRITGCNSVKTVYSSVEELMIKDDLIIKFENDMGSNLIAALKSDCYKVLIVSNLVKIKNPLEAIKAIKILADKNMKIKLFLVGKDDIEKSYSLKIKKYLQKNKLDNFVYYLNYQPKEILQHLYSKVDTLLIPSFSEGIPLVLVNALKLKVPIITTAVGGIPEIIKDNINGIITEPSYISIIKSICKLYNNTELRIILAENGYKTYSEYFNLDKNISIIENLINKQLNV